MNAKKIGVIPDVRYPTLYDLLQLHKDNVFSSMRVCLPATVVKANPVQGTVDVSVSVMTQDQNGNPIPYPPLSGIPVVVLQGGGIASVFPIAPGDTCLVFFADSSLNVWKINGKPAVDGTLRNHDIADGFALVGVNVPGTHVPFPGLSPTEGGTAGPFSSAIVIDKATGKVSIRNNTGTPVSLYLALSNLMTQLASLMGVLNSFVTTGGPTTQSTSPATQALLAPIATAITNVQTELTELLY